eukprot:5345244-Karenia_brevis.AAC.1
MQEIEGDCKERVDEIQNDLAKAMSECLTALYQERRISVGRMKDTMKDYKECAKTADEDMLRVLSEARSRLHQE